ncbi:unnamed protein product [Peniophora sp. CBMAI 1063]|nr:unnamed protein product [Peniophora sp. CBMAI 1063]
MPYVDVPGLGNDYVTFFYQTNSATGYASGIDPSKPTVLFLHPDLLDTSWIAQQFGDPRLDAQYNLISFDRRYAGKTQSRFNAKHDSYTDAVDVAILCSELRLPPVHVLTSGPYAGDVGARFCVLFPEMAKSLTMITPGAGRSADTDMNAFEEMFYMWETADDIQTLEFSLYQVVQFICGPDVDQDLADDLIAYYEKVYPPFRAARLVQVANSVVNRQPLSKLELASIQVPCLLLHGDNDGLWSKSKIDAMAADMTSVPGGAKVVTVKGGRGYMAIQPEFASVINRVYAQFLARLPCHDQGLRTSVEPLNARLRRALDDLADLTGDYTLADARDQEVLNSMSFSRSSYKSQQAAAKTYKSFMVRQKNAFSPLMSNGRPMRRYSERKHDHWFQGDRHGMSYAGKDHEFDPTPKERDDQDESPREQVRDIIQQRQAERDKVTIATAAVTKVDQSTLLKSGVARASASLPLGRLLNPR